MGKNRTPETRSAKYLADKQLRALQSGVEIKRLMAKLLILEDKIATMTELNRYVERHDELSLQEKYSILSGSIKMIDLDDKYWRSYEGMNTSTWELARRLA